MVPMKEITAKDARNGFGRLQLPGTMDALGQEAIAKGLTDAKLEALPADES